jgi:hypothetical protein
LPQTQFWTAFGVHTIVLHGPQVPKPLPSGRQLAVPCDPLAQVQASV